MKRRHLGKRAPIRGRSGYFGGNLRQIAPDIATASYMLLNSFHKRKTRLRLSKAQSWWNHASTLEEGPPSFIDTDKVVCGYWKWTVLPVYFLHMVKIICSRRLTSGRYFAQI